MPSGKRDWAGTEITPHSQERRFQLGAAYGRTYWNYLSVNLKISSSMDMSSSLVDVDLLDHAGPAMTR